MLADVYKSGQHIAELERFEDHVEFRYLDGYDGDPVASTLPLSDGTTVAPARQLPAFFAGLLPEGRRLTALRRVLKVSADDELAQLLAVGADTVGDVQVVPHGVSPTQTTPLVDEQPWSELDLTALFEASVGTDPDTRFDRVAVPGVQPKVSGKASGRMISFPHKSTSGFVIVKLDAPEYPRVTVNEHHMLTALQEVGLLDVPHHEIVTDSKGTAGLVVERFDRIVAEGEVISLPVEDGCQVSGRYAADKYGLDTIDVISRLADQCASPALARLELLQRFVISYLACDGDLHARNLAIYQAPDGLWRPTPVFDLVSTGLYEDMTLAAPFGGQEQVREIGLKRFLDAVEPLGLPTKAVTSMLGRTVEPFVTNVVSAMSNEELECFANRSKVLRVIKRRAELLSA